MDFSGDDAKQRPCRNIAAQREIERPRRVPFGVDVGCDVVAAAAKGSDVVERGPNGSTGSEKAERQINADRVAVDRAGQARRR